MFFGPWDHSDFREDDGFRSWDEPIEDPEPRGGLLKPSGFTLAVVADLDKVARLGWKYSHGWVEYDEMEGYNEALRLGDDQLRRDLGRFKGLREVLLSHMPDHAECNDIGETLLEYCDEKRLHQINYFLQFVGVKDDDPWEMFS